MTAVEADPQKAVNHGHVCNHKHVRLFDNFLRPLFHNTDKLFSPYVKPGMTALDIGCGRGWASLGLAKLVDDSGRVIAADLQSEMLDMVRQRAQKAGIEHRVNLHQCQTDRIGAAETVDFALAFWMAHETPDVDAFCREVHSLLKPGGHFYLVEPKIHVDENEFLRVVENLRQIGFSVVARPKVRLSLAAVFQK